MEKHFSSLTEKLNKEMKAITNQILKLKNILSKIKNVIEDINSRTAQTEQSVNLKRGYMKVYSWKEKRKKGKETKKIYGNFGLY